MERPIFLAVFCTFMALYISLSKAHPSDFILSDYGVNREGIEDDIVVVANNEEATSQDSLTKNDQICFTKACVKVAAKLMESMDEEIDPCEDFYQFACGTFEKNSIIPPDMSMIDEASILEDKLYMKKRRMLEGKSEQTEPKIVQSLRNLYKSCMDVENREKNSVIDLKNILTEVGGFPVVEGDKWNESSYNSYDIALKLAYFGLPGKMFTEIDYDIDAKNTSRWLLSIKEPSLDGEYGTTYFFDISRENFVKGLNDSKVEAYLKYLIETAKFLGASDEAAEKEMNDVLNLMIEIYKIEKPQEYWRDIAAAYNLMTLKEVSMVYPNVPWVDLFNIYLDLYNGPFEVTENDTVIVQSPSYLKDIQDLLANTSPRVQANFQISQIIPMSYLTEEALKIKDEYNKNAHGHQGRKSRWKECVKKTESLKVATSAMYVRRYFSSKSKKIMSGIVQNILDEFDITLDQLDWMDEETKENAHKKINLTISHIGYPEEILNNTLVDTYHEGLFISPKSYFNNFLNISKFFYKKENTKYKNTVKKNDWTDNAQTDVVNAWYKPPDNSISFPAAGLSGIFFDPDRPLYMDYGATGVTVGHEILHGFDDRGSQYDGHGNLVDWWSPEAKKIYLEKTRCVIEAYGNYTITVQGEKFDLNGVNTQGENIADMDGTKQAYRAYQRVVEKLTEPERLLPGLPYTQNQLFWLSGALTNCAAERPEFVKTLLLAGHHSPTKFRVNGPLFHLEEFSKDWNCPMGSKMNPEKKCQVW